MGLKIKNKIVTYLREGNSLQSIAKKFGIGIETLYEQIRVFGIDVGKIRESRNKEMVRQLKGSNYKVVAERFGVSVQHLRNLEAKYGKDKVSDDNKFYNKRWALKGWIGNYYNH